MAFRSRSLPTAEGTRWLRACAGLALLLPSCAPTVQVEAPKDPIVINLNVKIEHEIRVKVDEDLDELFEEEADLF